MENTVSENASVSAEKTITPRTSLDATLANSAAIRRLIEEVKNEETTDLSANYNRMHNRHNR